MRKSRFSGLSDSGPEAVRPLALGELLMFDFHPPESEDDERVARERARSVGLSLPFVAASHLLWGVVLLFALHRAGAGAGFTQVSVLFFGVLLVDLAFSVLLRRRTLRPHAIVQLAALYTLITAALWAAAAWSAMAGPAAQLMITKAALIAGLGSTISAFYMIPGLLILSCLSTFAGVTLLKSQEPLVPIAGAFVFFLAGLSIYRARDLVLTAQRRLLTEWQSKKALRFIADFEQSGRGWFWETNADGCLTYVSEPLARHLNTSAAALLGRAFEKLLMVQDEEKEKQEQEQAEGEGDGRRTLGFHLSARFPFADVIVRAPAAQDIWWLLSGSPNFDDYGRFLGFRGIGTNLSEQRRSEAETTKLARYDSLTGLPNRAMMRRTLDEALANAVARRKGCALMMIDLDKFKQVNDTLGHPVGDKLLKKVAQRLSDVLGEEGQVGRLGGDEFEAILPGVEEEGRLGPLAARMIDEVSRPYSIEGHQIVIGASIGIAVARPGKAYASALIKDADLALYAAKAGGRGTYRFFAAEMHAEAAERQILENDLREALARDELRLLYQPIVNSVSEEAVAFEALLRWHHPLRGVLPPLKLIPIAEECGLMPRIGEWVIRSACAEAAKWPAHVRVAVNLSPAQFADPGLSAIITSALASAQLEPDRLELEITEAVFLADSAASERVLAGLKTIGVRLALDNFGTGHSGLGHIRNAPLDKIKIDQSFVRGASASGSRNAAIVRAIVVLAESLGMDTTAEGAETLEEIALIRSLGCSQVQGFIFGRPMPGEDALALAANSKPPSEVVGFSRPPRHRLIRVGTLHWEGQALTVRLRNISTGGAMIECDRPIAPGTGVRLDLEEAGILEAEVRWSERGEIGLQFRDAFELRKLARVKPGAAGLKMLKPQYLDADPAQLAPPPLTGPSPLATKRRSGRL